MKVKSMESERMINALMSHLAPVIREVQQQHGRTLHDEFEQRIAAVEIGSAPAEVANQVAVAARMLAESPPVGRGVDGDGGAREIVTVQRGEAGPRGLPGLPGPQGERGERGEPGQRGRDGTGIAGAAVSRDGDLLLTLSDGVILTLAIDKVQERIDNV